MPRLSKGFFTKRPQAVASRRDCTAFHIEELESRVLMVANLAGPAIAQFDVASLSADTWRPGVQISPIQVESNSLDNLDNEQAIRTWIRQLVDEQYAEQFGTTFEQLNHRHTLRWIPVTDPLTIGLTPINLRVAATFSSDASYDATNVQEVGVDEADLVESDGERLFLLRGDELLIFRANGVDDLALSSRVKLDSRVSQMFLHGDRLAIVTNQNDYISHSKSAVTILDVSNAAKPTFVQKSEVDGQLIDLRAIDGKVVMITAPIAHRLQFPALQHRLIDTVEPPAPYAKFASLPESPSVISGIEFTGHIDLSIPSLNGFTFSAESPAQPLTYQYETREEYLSRTEDMLVRQLTIGYRSYDASGTLMQQRSFIDSVADLRSLMHGEGSTRLAVSIFDMHAHTPGPTDTLLIRGGSAETKVYATQESIYLFTPTSWYGNAKTEIVKLSFDADQGKIAPAARGQLSGRLLNQFAADEHNDVLRVVMTDVGGRRGGQAVYTLAEQGPRLKVLGELNSIAPNELLHSVTFQEEEVHFVTYRKVDPLFAVDLSDPTQPTITGELKIPGYSEMLIEIDENHLLGIGRGASDGLFREMQLSIFDVTDSEDPQRSHLYSLEGGRNTSTEATGGRWTNGDGDHHAITFLEDEGILALPVKLENAWWRSSVTSSLDFDNGIGGLMLFQIDVDQGIHEIATIEHDSMIRRSLQIGDRLYVVSPSAVTVHDLENPSETIDQYAISEASPSDYTTVEQFVSPLSLQAAVESLVAEAESNIRTHQPHTDVRLPSAGTTDQDELFLLLATDTMAQPHRSDIELELDTEDFDHKSAAESTDDATDLTDAFSTLTAP